MSMVYLLYFFNAYKSVMPMFFFFQAEDGIRDHCVTGVQTCALPISETLSKIDDPYLRERALDIEDVTWRVIRNLQGKAPKAFLALTEPHILVAHNLTPSDAATMNRERVLGIATDLGSRTSHTAIMARSLNIPAIVGLHNATEKLETGQHVLLDGTDGLLVVDPTPETFARYGELESKR